MNPRIWIASLLELIGDAITEAADLIGGDDD